MSIQTRENLFSVVAVEKTEDGWTAQGIIGLGKYDKIPGKSELFSIFSDVSQSDEKR